MKKWLFRISATASAILMKVLSNFFQPLLENSEKVLQLDSDNFLQNRTHVISDLSSYDAYLYD
jgi:hypothetical protein